MDNSAGSARVVLEQLLKRLEPIVGSVSRGDFGFWVGDPEGEAKHRERSQNGWYRLATAVLGARDALASGNPEKIVMAALICPTFERDGIKQIAVNAQKQAISDAEAKKRRNG